MLTKLKAASVQAVVNWSIEPAQAIVLKNVRQLGLTIPIFQSHGFANIQYVKAAGRGGRGRHLPGGEAHRRRPRSRTRTPRRRSSSDYKRAYEARFKEDVSAFGGHACDAFHILARALREAGTDREKVRSAIETMRGFVGTAGIFDFSPTDHNGLGIDSFEMLTVKDGKFAILGKPGGT